MKSILDQKEVSLSSTLEGKKKLQIKENNHLFNHIGKLAADHDVTVSNTMIKITYKKALKDQNSADNIVNCNTDSDFGNDKGKPNESTNLRNSEFSFVMKSPKLPAEGNKVFYSTPKQQTTETDKSKKYVNGLNLSNKINNSEGMSSVSEVQRTCSSQEDGGSSQKKTKMGSNKQSAESELDKRFLKGNGLVKPKTSIINKNGGEGKKLKLGKGSDKKINKLENGVKKRTGVVKKMGKVEGVKHKASNTELNILVKCKKMKVNESKIKQSEGSVEDVHKSGSKKQIMLVDPDLPKGWTRFIRTKNKGCPNEQYVVYVVNPQGKKFRFKWKLRKYLQRTNSSLDVNQFFFGLYQRPKSSNSSAVEKSKTSVPEEMSVEDLNDVESDPDEENEVGKDVSSYESSNNQTKGSDGKEILFFDPNLPFGWKRVIHSNSSNGRKHVQIISPDGKIFRRRYRLNEYLIKHQYTHNLDRFYFGLYPKKEGTSLDYVRKGPEVKSPSLLKLYKSDGSGKLQGSAILYNKTKESDLNREDCHEITEDSKGLPNSPMYDDPNLPEGWKRFIKIRSCGESAGRMEVVIVSPEGRRHRSRKHLEHYLMQKQLNYKAEDFDFTVFGRSSPKRRPPSTSTEPEPDPEPEQKLEAEPEPIMIDLASPGTKKKFSTKPVPELDISSLRETVVSPEGRLINTVNGLMLSSGLSTARNERRQRLPRREHEKLLKSYLNSEGDTSFDGSHIPVHWIQRLVKCRADVRILEPDALLAIAESTKEFLKRMSVQALTNSGQPENGLKYEDIAELVDCTEGLSFLRTLIPKKITFREYVKLNRPKQFLSFT